MLDRPSLKAMARDDIRQSRPNIILFTLFFLIISYVISTLSMRISGFSEYYTRVMEAAASGSYDLNSITPPLVSNLGVIILVALTLMSTFLSVGYSLFALNTARHSKASYGNLFDPFAHFLRVLWLLIRMGIFIWLWSLLLVIPGIVAAYRYSQSIFILLEHPELSAGECMHRSRELTNGHKGELFVLDLSFIGWYLLTVIPIVTLWVQPYYELTRIQAYFVLRDRHEGVDRGGYGYGYGYGTQNDESRPPWEQ